MGPVDEENIGGSAGGGGDRSSGERISQRGEKLFMCSSSSTVRGCSSQLPESAVLESGS